MQADGSCLGQVGGGMLGMRGHMDRHGSMTRGTLGRDGSLACGAGRLVGSEGCLADATDANIPKNPRPAGGNGRRQSKIRWPVLLEER